MLTELNLSRIMNLLAVKEETWRVSGIILSVGIVLSKYLFLHLFALLSGHAEQSRSSKPSLSCQDLKQQARPRDVHHFTCARP